MTFILSPEVGLAARAGSPLGARSSGPAAAARDSTALSFLESRYPGVVRALTLLWGYPELSDFLARVAAGLDPRFHALEPAAMAELMLLGELHRALCPSRAPAASAFGRPAAARPVPYRG